MGIGMYMVFQNEWNGCSLQYILVINWSSYNIEISGYI
jgi:hypothetical protein